MNLHPYHAFLGNPGIMGILNAASLVYKGTEGKINQHVSFNTKKHMEEVKT